MKAAGLVAFAALLLVPGSADAQRRVEVVDIRANPQRWTNVEVEIVGQVVQPVANPPGTTRGVYLLVDDSDPRGIVVRSRSLPRPGPVFEVTGTVVRDAASGEAVIDEIERNEIDPGSPIGAVGGGGGGGGSSSGGFRVDWTVAGLVGLGVLAIAFLLVLALRGGGARTTAAAADASAGAKVDLELEVDEPGGGRRTERFRTAPIAIGRDPSNDLVLDDERVSRRHAEIVVREGELHVVDELSTHGTFVDGARVESAEIRSGTTIRMGETDLKVR